MKVKHNRSIVVRLVAVLEMTMLAGSFFSILGRGPRVYQTGKISAVNLYIVHNYVIFGE